MDKQEDESKIREFYKEARRLDERNAPSFRAVVSESSSPLHRPQLRWALVAIALLAVMSPLVLRFLDTSEELAAVELSVEWQAPTDFLLDFSEDLFVSSIPDIDFDPAGWADEPAVDPQDGSS